MQISERQNFVIIYLLVTYDKILSILALHYILPVDIEPSNIAKGEIGNFDFHARKRIFHTKHGQEWGQLKR